MSFSNTWVRVAIAVPIPIVLALAVTIVLGATCDWFAFVGAEIIGIFIYIFSLRLLKLDPMHYTKSWIFQQPWEKAYLWPDPLRIRVGAASVATAICICIVAFFLSDSGFFGFISALSGGVLGTWAYEGVRVFQGVYDAKRVA